jgi:uncharacterized membrane protein (TIGR02234 family)
VLTGLVGGGLVTAAGARPWASATVRLHGFPASEVSVGGSDVAPLVSPLGVVVLAGVVVVLATRRTGRRVAGVLVAVAALLAAVQTLLAGPSLATALQARLLGGASGSVVAATTPWRWLCLTGAVLGCGFGVLALWRGPAWASMGSRYDAPAARRESTDEQTDLWRALDRGDDPTR